MADEQQQKSRTSEEINKLLTELETYRKETEKRLKTVEDALAVAVGQLSVLRMITKEALSSKPVAPFADVKVFVQAARDKIHRDLSLQNAQQNSPPASTAAAYELFNQFVSDMEPTDKVELDITKFP